MMLIQSYPAIEYFALRQIPFLPCKPSLTFCIISNIVSGIALYNFKFSLHRNDTIMRLNAVALSPGAAACKLAICVT